MVVASGADMSSGVEVMQKLAFSSNVHMIQSPTLEDVQLRLDPHAPVKCGADRPHQPMGHENHKDQVSAVVSCSDMRVFPPRWNPLLRRPGTTPDSSRDVTRAIGFPARHREIAATAVVPISCRCFSRACYLGLNEHAWRLQLRSMAT